MLHIERLSIDDGADIYNLTQNIGSCENEFKNTAFGLSYQDFKKWLVQQYKWSEGDCLPEGYVPQTIYWLYDDEVPVAMGKIRHELNDNSRIVGGNIGYAVDSRFRGKGYATILLKFLIDKAKKMGINDILLTVEKYNPASRRVIEKAGGLLDKETEERWYFVF